MNAGPHHLPLLSRDSPMSVVTPVIPLNFVHPGLSLSQTFSIIRAYWKLSTVILLLVLSLTAVIMTLLPRTYTAMVTLMVNYEVNDPLNGKELPFGQLGSYMATQMELMQTPEALLAVIDRLKLTENKDYAQGYSGGSGTLSEWVAIKVKKNLAIYQGQQGNQLIYITYSANNPTEAATVANTLAEVYKEQDYMRSTGPPGERAKYYEQQLSELKGKVDQAQRQVTEFHQLNSLIDEGNKTNVDMVLLATLEGRLLEAQGIRVGILAQPDWHSAEPFTELGRERRQESARRPSASGSAVRELDGLLHTTLVPGTRRADLWATLAQLTRRLEEH